MSNAAIRVPIPFLCLLVLAACCGSGSVKPDAPGRVEISEVVAAIQDAIDPFWQPKAGLPPLSTVKIVLQTVHDTKFTGEADYLIVALKGYYDRSVTQELDLTLAPPAAARVETLPPSLTKALHDAIESAQKQIKATYSRGGHSLNTQQIDVQISFAVTWDVSAGVNKWSILPISVNPSAETSLKTTNSITVSFKKPGPGG